MFESNNEIIRKRSAEFVAQMEATKVAMGIKHDRTKPPSKTKIKYKLDHGDIYRISFIVDFGQIMSHQGAGKYPDKRKKKPFYNQNAGEFIEQLADELAIKTGEVISQRFVLA